MRTDNSGKSIDIPITSTVSSEKFVDPDKFASVYSDTWSRSHFWRDWTLPVIICLAFASILNYFVNPFSIYAPGIFEPYRENSYVEKTRLFEKLKTPSEVLILGSSRAGTLDPTLVTEITGKSCFNWALPSAGVEIFNAVLRISVDEYKNPVEMVILCVDPEVFHPDLWISPQALLAKSFTPYFRGTGLWPKVRSIINSGLRLITLEQLNASFGVIRREFGDPSEKRDRLYRADGFGLYSANERAIADGTYDLKAVISERLTTYPKDNLCFMTGATLSQDRMKKWGKMLEYCDSKGIIVYCYLPPAHPRYLELMDNFGALTFFDRIRQFLNETVTEHGGIFRDYTSLDSFGGDPNRFYDEVHMRKANNDLILKNLLAAGDAESERGDR
ncbi:MAG: hypothetical protein ABIC40_01930 [bacterium]